VIRFRQNELDESRRLWRLLGTGSVLIALGKMSDGEESGILAWAGPQ